MVEEVEANLTGEAMKKDVPVFRFVGVATDPFPKLQGKCTSAKSNLTKAMTKLEKTSKGFSGIETDAELLTKQRFARSFIEAFEKVETRKADLEDCFDNLIEHIHDMTAQDFQPNVETSAVVGSAENTCHERVEEVNIKLLEYEDLVKKAEAVLSTQNQLNNKGPGPSQVQGTPSGGAAALPVFRAQSDLKPPPIEKSSTYREVVHFVEIFFNYLACGYSGAERIPHSMVAVQLQPFVCESWWATMVEKGIKGKSPDEAKKIIMDVAAIHIPVHDRRLDFLRSKKDGKCHSEFLRELEEKIELTDWQNWTRDQMVSTLFLTFAEIEFGKIVTEHLAKPELNMAEMRTQIRNLEASPWYKPKATAKVAGGGVVGNGGGQGSRWCSVCERDTHNTDQCWGPCSNCNKLGHRSETCRNAKSEAKKAELEAAKRAKEKKEKKEQQKKLKAEKKKLEKERKEKERKKLLEDAKKTKVEDLSSSDCDSPVLIDARANRAQGLQGFLNTGRANKQSNFYTFPNLGDIHEEIENTPLEKLAEEIGRVKLARKEGTSPTIEGNISGSHDMRKSTTQPFVCDTGCSWPVISDKIILEMGIPIRPFKHKMNIVDASGNSLNLLGSSTFYITIPQVLGEKCERVEAAVLADNNVDAELLVSLSLLIKWDLVPPQFPRQTVSAYFNQILTKNKLGLSCAKLRAN